MIFEGTMDDNVNEMMKQRLEALKADLKKKTKKLKVISRIKNTKEHVRKTLKEQTKQQSCEEEQQGDADREDQEGSPKHKDRKLSVSFLLETEVDDAEDQHTACTEPEFREPGNIIEGNSSSGDVCSDSRGRLSSFGACSSDSKLCDKENVNAIDHSPKLCSKQIETKSNNNGEVSNSCDGSKATSSTCDLECDSYAASEVEEEKSEELDEKNIILATQFVSKSRKKPLLRILKSDSSKHVQSSVMLQNDKPSGVSLNKTESDAPATTIVESKIEEKQENLNAVLLPSLSVLVAASESPVLPSKPPENTDPRELESEVPVVSSGSNSMVSMSEWQVGSEENMASQITGEETTSKVHRKRTRKSFSSEVVDFSYLEEENSGDMYSGIKNRRRSSRRSLVPNSGSQDSQVNSTNIISTESSLSGSYKDGTELNPSNVGTSQSQGYGAEKRKPTKRRRASRRSLATERLHTALAILVSYATSAVEKCEFSLPPEQYGDLIKHKCGEQSNLLPYVDFEVIDPKNSDLSASESTHSSQSSSQEPIPCSQISHQRSAGARKLNLSRRALLRRKSISSPAPNKCSTPIRQEFGDSASPVLSKGLGTVHLQDVSNVVHKEHSGSQEKKGNAKLYGKHSDDINIEHTSEELEDCSEFLVDEEESFKQISCDTGIISAATSSKEDRLKETALENTVERKSYTAQSFSEPTIHECRKDAVTIGEVGTPANGAESETTSSTRKKSSAIKLHCVHDIQKKDEEFIDVKCGCIKADGIRRDVFIIATKHQLNFWLAAEDPLSWNCLFTWNFPQMTLLAIHSLPSESEVSLVVKAQSSVGIQVFHLAFMDPDNKSFIHITSSDRLEEDIQIYAMTPVTFVIGRKDQCIYYEIDTIQKDVKKTVTLETVCDDLVSIHPVEGIPDAVLGLTSSAIYLWNCTKGLLVLKLELTSKPVPSRCLHASSEKGVLALLMSSESQNECVLSALISNPMSRRLVVMPLWKSLAKMQLMYCRKELLTCTTADNKLQLLSAFDGRLVSEIGIADGIKSLESLDGCRNIILCSANHCSIYALQ